MKTILSVVQDGENVRFETDIDTINNPDVIHDVVVNTSFAMMTSLWGEKERNVLAMIRALCIADLGISVNRKQMIGFLDEASKTLEDTISEARQNVLGKGGNVIFLAPGETRPDKAN